MFVKVRYSGFYALGDDIVIGNVHFMKCFWYNLRGLIMPIGKKHIVNPIHCNAFLTLENNNPFFFFAFEYGLGHYHVFLPDEKSYIKLLKKYDSLIQKIKSQHYFSSPDVLTDYMIQKDLENYVKCYVYKDKTTRICISIDSNNHYSYIIESLHIHSPDENKFFDFPAHWEYESQSGVYQDLTLLEKDVLLNKDDWLLIK